MRIAPIGFLVVFSTSAFAQAGGGDPGVQDIQVGSSRIGGPGLTPQERAANADSGEDEEVLTEENLPPKGNKKRLPALHKIAARYVRGSMWREACERYDQIVEEEGPTGMDAPPDAKGYAARAYLECANSEAAGRKFDKMELYLKKSETYGGSDYRHAAMRRKVKRETYKEEMAKGNTEKALVAFRAYQQEKADEDERIWMGAELTKIAWAAYNAKDEVNLKRAIADADSVAPMNSDLRRLKEKLEDEGSILKQIFSVAAVAVVIAFLATRFFAWRARARVEGMVEGGLGGGKKNKYLDD
ncbi:MAG: hypothetical protein U1E65_23830 [Myxococcota bacterium]